MPTFNPTLSYEDLTLPVYLNSRPILTIGGITLTVSDILPAAILGGLNLLMISETGGGKTQATSDIYNGLFGGDTNGIWLTGRPDLSLNDVIVKLNMAEGKRQLNHHAVERYIFVADEVNRAPPPIQNQLLGLGAGIIEDPEGTQYWLGKNGYFILVGSANMGNGNGDYFGTFQLDKALLNRFHITLDLDFHKRTFEDKQAIMNIGKADPKIVRRAPHDISEAILADWRKIQELTLEPDAGVQLALHYISEVADTCTKMGSKTRAWPYHCQDCANNEGLCGLLRAPSDRTSKVVLKFTMALDYMLQLKAKALGREVERFPPHQLVFKAFEISSAYQSVLNPAILDSEYDGEAARMMSDVINGGQGKAYQGLLPEFEREVGPYALLSVEALEDYNEVVTQWYNDQGIQMPLFDAFLRMRAQKIGRDFDELKAEAQASQIIEPYKGKLAWIPSLLERYKELHSREK
jgi:MoxR-like ATPase